MIFIDILNLVWKLNGNKFILLKNEVKNRRNEESRIEKKL